MLSSIARLLLKIGGWTLVGDHPSVPKAVIIAAPHTSNWDGIWGLIAKVALGVDVHFFGKDTLFWFPLGFILRIMGGIPLDRANPGSSVEKAVRGFAVEDSYYFAMAPEGTRRHKPYWKTGFYRIAVSAGVPVVLAFFDYERRRLGIGATVEITGDPDKDLARIREFYDANARPKHGDKMGPVAFDPEARIAGRETPHDGSDGPSD